MKEYFVSILPYLVALALVGVYVLLVGGLHVLALYMLSPAYPQRFPRLAAWMRSTGIDWPTALRTLADNVPRPPILGAERVPMDPLMNVVPPKSSKPRIPPIAGMTLSLLLLVSGPALLLIPLSSCTTLPAVSPGVATETIDAGCKLVGILDPSGAPVAAICESLAPVLGPIIASAISALEKKGELAKPSYVVLTRGEKVVGWARSDVAVAVQAKLDAAP